MEWSPEETLKFIEDYRNCSVLWQITHDDYKNRQVRRDALQRLGGKYSLKTKALLNKIKSLRSYFHKEHKKNVEFQDDERSSWFAYKHLMFILEGDNRKMKDEKETGHDDDIFVECDINQSLKLDEEDLQRESDPLDVEPPIKKEKKHELESVQNEIGKSDDYSIFGEYVASRVRKLQNPTLETIAQHKINTILFEIEMNLHSSATASSNL